jgi:hypothetical protein
VGPRAAPAAAPTVPAAASYDRLVERVCAVVGATGPEDSGVVVVSKGDERLLELGVRQAWHFPLGADGGFAGHYPADGRAAVEQLEALRRQGADYVVFPETAFWWLEHYLALRAHLEKNHRAVVRDDDTCMIYELTEAGR